MEVFVCLFMPELVIFCNSDTKIKLRHQKGVDCTFFGIFSELLRGTAKFWGSKNENIAFLSDWLMPISSFTLKGFISAVSDLLGYFFQCHNQITNTGRFWLSVTVDSQHSSVGSCVCIQVLREQRGQHQGLGPLQ